MKKKIYLIQPTYRDQDGRLLKGERLYIVSLALPALSAAMPPDWQTECCYEYFDEVNFDTDASVVGISSMGYEIFRGIEIATEFRKRGKIVLFGGDQLDRVLADTWLYDCATRTWEQRFPKECPLPRAGHILAWLPRAKKIVLAGGYAMDVRDTVTIHCNAAKAAKEVLKTVKGQES